jgi:hypothetical protein
MITAQDSAAEDEGTVARRAKCCPSTRTLIVLLSLVLYLPKIVTAFDRLRGAPSAP